MWDGKSAGRTCPVIAVAFALLSLCPHAESNTNCALRQSAGAVSKLSVECRSTERVAPKDSDWLAAGTVKSCYEAQSHSWKVSGCFAPVIALRARGGCGTDASGEGQRSKMGQKTYWSHAYEQGWETEGWFQAETDCTPDILKMIEQEVGTRLGTNPFRCVDLGCGSGDMLLSLLRMGCRDIVGIDYIQKAVDIVVHKLAQEVKATSQTISGGYRLLSESQKVELFADDILNPKACNYGSFDLLHDKGTLDAILLGEEGNVEKYLAAIEGLASPNAIAVITSCNLTLEELVELLEITGSWKLSQRSYPLPMSRDITTSSVWIV